MSKVNIVFQNETLIFFPGQPIVGYIEVTLTQTTTCKALTVKLKGFARVMFKVTETNNHSDGTKTRTKYCTQTENYYSLKYNLWGDGTTSQDLLEGTHQFPFTFILPPSTPSSFESQYGFVRHKCESELKFASMFKRNIICMVPFSVISIYDLNTDQYAEHPILDSQDKSFCCLCCTSGPISFAINIDHRGFVPGEDIVICAECSNRSNKTVSKSRAEVLQIISYRAQGHSKIIQNIVCFKELPMISPGEDCYWASERLKIPPLPPSNLQGCNVIDVRYIFVFKLVPSGISLALESKTDIIIGSIPLMRNFNQFNSPELTAHPPQSVSADRQDKKILNSGNDVVPSAPPLVFPESAKYPELPPPSYEECLFLQNNVSQTDIANPQDDDDIDNIQFSPRYITYNTRNIQSQGIVTAKEPGDSSNLESCESLDLESEYVEENNFKI